ncbi:MAG: type I glyceraldehyde-3-phosphate dehydrogenase [Acidimicrobiia bacterium]|nr:type I glyceraldehyde-3-phosphate dehydrogenase [Acidimicrobiia bacterium]MYB24249.1 type I glyceraldehyde-3-phosphate dehydrogenase [Acidimicrobiia bacterium]MYE66758.1 type I glyceraldehyde-3-phosphate dehydrogenase [Acidimicrobiia bacterium]MYJ14563.1 type I glyceraldehyde-3-phosphate dehydrogenase [Acidimicrobiia bacterium]
MSVRVGINGFGRIGRNFYRALRARRADLDVVAVNDLGAPEAMAHLLRRDSVLGTAPWEVRATDGGISVDGDLLPVLAQRDPASLPWGELGVQVVVESTGFFTSRDKAAAHLDAGAQRVVISAPAKDVDATFVVGVNDHTFDPDSHLVVSNASCTTNCLVPMVKVLDDAFGVERGFMSTVHAYTGDQMLVDGPHSDLRRSRAAAINIIPTSTGAARATGLVLDAMAGRLDGIALRVPVADGSLTDLTATLERPADAAEVNAAFERAAASPPLAGVLEWSEEPLVSSDIVGSPASCVFDSGLTMAGGNLVKVCGWYDNEWGYSNRLVDLVARIGA